jgi:hypothetical protein
MCLSTIMKEKVDFRHIKIWLWVYFSKEKLNLDISKYKFKYICQKKSWLYTWPNMTLSVFVTGKVNFRYVKIWLWVCLLLKENLTLGMSKYDLECVY